MLRCLPLLISALLFVACGDSGPTRVADDFGVVEQCEDFCEFCYPREFDACFDACGFNFFDTPGFPPCSDY
ncbi:MAG: hypothetical protein AAF436_20650 [Myxococcota bacterium]